MSFIQLSPMRLTRGETVFKFFLASFYIVLSVGYNIYESDYLKLQETDMSKKLVIGVALALVLVSGAFLSARADCGYFSSIHLPYLCSSFGSARDRDVAALDKDVQGNNTWERDLMSPPHNSY